MVSAQAACFHIPIRSDANTTEKQYEESGMSIVISQQLKIQQWIEDLFKREEGQDMIEYALLAALISIVAIGIILLVGPYLKNLFQDVVNGLGSA